MTVSQIKTLVRYGTVVHWSSPLYTVIQDGIDQFLIMCSTNGSCVGLTHQDGETLNGEPSDFYVAGAR